MTIKTTNQVKDIVLMSTADWDHPFWTNKQHTAQALVKLGFRVFYIDSLGSRKLRLKQTKDLKRVWQRVQRLFSKPREVEKNLWVWSPCVLPVNFEKLSGLNRILFSVLLKYWLKKLSFCPRPLFWTYNPLSFLYMSPKHFSHIVYHCVDNIAEQPGAFAELIQSQEKQLFKQANYVFVTSRALEQLALSYSKNVHYFPNVVDFEHFHQACLDITVPADLQAIPHPRAGFIGAISAYKVDLELLCKVAIALPDVSLVLIGAIGEGDPDTKVDQLLKLPNVYFLGPKRYDQLPHYLKGLDVCLIPANINEYTRAMFPMKFFEYLAAGKPIVATDIDAIKEYGAVYSVAGDADAFAKKIMCEIENNDLTFMQDRLALAKKNTYLTRTKSMLECLDR